MAEDKNGFILYKDLIHTVKKMPKEKQAELFMHILRYVNDENPETDDLIIDLAFEPIKQSLKRDLRKYETRVSKNSDAGRIGNLKRWNPDLFVKYEKGLITLIKAEEIANDRKCDKVVAKVADSDSVIDSDSDSDRDRDIDKEYKALPFPFLNSLLDLGAEKQIAVDWLKVRKTKKATNTQTAFKGFKTELEKSGNEINEVLKICVENSWAGFKTEWIANKIKPAVIPGETSEERTRRLYVESMKSGKIKMNY